MGTTTQKDNGRPQPLEDLTNMNIASPHFADVWRVMLRHR